jgi:chromate reductase
MKILGISGSLRKNSYNTSTLKSLTKYFDKNIEYEVITLEEIPFFNQDAEEKEIPSSVKDLKEKISEADILFIATPEYDNMISGVLKNALEWVGRYYDNSLKDKPIAIMGASNGGFGTVRAQNQLMLLLTIQGALVSPVLRFPISNVDKKFDEEGNVIDSELKDDLKEFVSKTLEFFK